MSDYTYWYSIASSSGASGLAAITDATSASDPMGTDCDSTYWLSHAYDQVRALYVKLGSNPGSGVDGNFTINQDAAGNETSSLIFGTTGLHGGSPSIQWSSAVSMFVVNKDLMLYGNLGSDFYRVAYSYFGALDATSVEAVDLTTTGIGLMADLEVTGTLQAATLNADVLAFTGDITTEGNALILNSGGDDVTDAVVTVNRGAYTNAELRWVSASSAWKVKDLGTGDLNTLISAGATGIIEETLVFAGDGGLYGTSHFAARSDHTHSGGTLAASGTEEQSWTINTNWVEADGAIGLRFYSGDNYLQFNPSLSKFQFSHEAQAENLTATSLLTTVDLSVSGYILGDMLISGTIVKLNAALGGSTPPSNASIQVERYSNDVELRWNETTDTWQYTNDGATYYNMLGSDPSTSAVVIPGNLSLASGKYITGDLTFTGSSYTFNYGNQATPVKWFVYPGNAYIGYVNSVWVISNGTSQWDVVGATKTQTLTNKTLTSPIISSPTVTGGALGGVLTVSADATFSGVTAFTAPSTVSDTMMFSSAPRMYADTPMILESNCTDVVRYLNADAVDGVHAGLMLTIDTDTSRYEATTDLDMNGFNILGYTVAVASHKASHQSGGADEFDGVLGSATGTKSSTFRINSTPNSVAGILYLNNQADYWVSASYPGAIAVGGSDIDLIPGQNASNQDLGSTGRRWRNAYLQGFLGISLSANSSGFTNYSDGALWAKSGSPQQLISRLSGSDVVVADSNAKTGMSGTTQSSWSVNGTTVSLSTHNHTGTYQPKDPTLDEISGAGWSGTGGVARVGSPTMSGLTTAGTINLSGGGRISSAAYVNLAESVSPPSGLSAGSLWYSNDGSAYLYYSGGSRKLWGDHNDGTGSGLDADKLDGSHASDFSLTSHTHAALYQPLSDTLTTLAGAGYSGTGSFARIGNPTMTGITMQGNIDCGGTGKVTNATHLNLSQQSSAPSGVANGSLWYNNAGSLYLRVSSADKQVWTEYTDGTGSGLDADLLDGNHASYFSPTTHTHTGLTTTTGNQLTMVVGSATVAKVDINGLRMDGYKIHLSTDTNTYLYYDGSTQRIKLFKNGTEVASW